MKLTDYIQGNRRGAEAHRLELEAMHDPLLADAIDGFDAVPGDHAATLERLEAKIHDSTASGRAVARARKSRLYERRMRGWSVATATLLIGGVVGGGMWLMHRDLQAENPPRKAGVRVGSEAEIILPPVRVIKDDTPPTDIAATRLDREELRDFSHVAPMADTTQTAAFRRYLVAAQGSCGPVHGVVTIGFEVAPDGRPASVVVIDAPGAEAAAAATELLNKGPDWPGEPARKTITINL